MEERDKKILLEGWLAKQRARPQIRSAPTAGHAVGKVLRPLSKSTGSGRTSSARMLSRVWPEIMGPRWSKISEPQKFTGGRDGRTLIIGAPGPAAALIMAQSGPIIARLNGHLGDGTVTRIKVVQTRMRAPAGPTAKPGLPPRKAAALQAGLSSIENVRLRQAMGKLGRGVLRAEEDKQR